MKLLDYDAQKALELLKADRLPNGVNKGIIDEFMNSGKPIATVAVRSGDRKAVAQKAQNLRYVAKKYWPKQVRIYARTGSVILVREDQVKNLGV